MSRILIIYFSQTGTTGKVAASIAEGLRTAGHRVDLCNIRDEEPPLIEDYDVLGLGTPAYYFRPPFNVSDYVNRLHGLKGMPSFVFVLHGTYPGDTGNELRKALARKGSKEIGYFRSHGADFYQGYLKAGYLFSPDHPSAEELVQADAFGRNVAGILAGKAYTRPEKDPPLSLIHRLEKYLANRWLVRMVYSRLFSLNKQKCNVCGLCIKQCPTGNIIGDMKGRPVWDRRCLICLSCEMNCPQEAIMSPINWPVFQPVIRHNVRRASQDPALDHIRVKHSRGRTRRA
jgi:flavodoxin/ferredoxin